MSIVTKTLVLQFKSVPPRLKGPWRDLYTEDVTLTNRHDRDLLAAKMLADWRVDNTQELFRVILRRVEVIETEVVL